MTSVAASPPGTEMAADSPGRAWRAVVEGMSFIVLEQPELWLPALAGFLVRGGLLLFALPVVVLPSAVGLGNFVGPTSVTAAGPSGGLLALFIAVLATAIAWLGAAAVIGSVIDRMLVLRHVELLGGQLSPPNRRGAAATLGELVSIRLLLLVPVGVAVGWAGQRLVEVGYQELILPTNLDTPLLVRVIGRGADGLLVLAAVWLACETLGAIDKSWIAGEHQGGFAGFSDHWVVAPAHMARWIAPTSYIGLIAVVLLVTNAITHDDARDIHIGALVCGIGPSLEHGDAHATHVEDLRVLLEPRHLPDEGLAPAPGALRILRQHLPHLREFALGVKLHEPHLEVGRPAQNLTR